ncbi:deoxyribodipyrimidine photo-lyase [Lutibacter oricola]|uniref:Deoxyribodipyrimidine photo-lyase n=1 Tax=Lutibacter oricola TaxID=762486 RepID=A0A1H3A9C0_9FLAO|nr:deoxyribodipyrimidine photo-lyase [Lutibacter oricola]SDX25794.1 deoxyribodipyrimidine photo-lyase [Lutibacter oricola]
MKSKFEIAVFWFRRDLRLHDNTALFYALNSGCKVLPIFIFDEAILNELPKNDARASFIHQTLNTIHIDLTENKSSLYIKKGNVKKVWQELLNEYNIKKVFFNKDYEPYALKRDTEISNFLIENNIEVSSYKDQVIFESGEILKADGKPYTVYTPYKNKWWNLYNSKELKLFPSENFKNNFVELSIKFPSLGEIDFIESSIKVKKINRSSILDYEKFRDFPTSETSNTSVYLRFGLISVRKLFKYAQIKNETYCNELIWREFFMQILHQFPKVVNENFKPKYNFIPWRNNEEEFKKWCEGNTGYPIVDAGMRELNQTGYMHNRVRMVVASFLNKHLLIDWRWGEAYFAEKLLDYDLAANNGNWQWAAGTGCDSAPYFRVFNPTTQQHKFDPDFKYIKKWNPNYKDIPEIVEHKFARLRYLEVVKASFVQ